jgi:magnesium-transporting ATPase (P-type)
MRLFLDQCRSPLVLILIVAATITSLLSALHIEDLWMDTAVIVGVVVLNIILGFYQEGKAEGALKHLKKWLYPHVQYSVTKSNKLFQLVNLSQAMWSSLILATKCLRIFDYSLQRYPCR